MNYVKMFIAGIAFPTVLLPFIMLFAWSLGYSEILTIPFIHFIPLIWGIWNILYFVFFAKVLPGSFPVKLLLTGGILGLLIALYGVFGLHLPELLDMPYSMDYLPLVIAPVLYALIWLFIVSPINHLLGLHAGFFKD
jgi:hypothetical protein